MKIYVRSFNSVVRRRALSCSSSIMLQDDIILIFQLVLLYHFGLSRNLNFKSALYTYALIRAKLLSFLVRYASWLSKHLIILPYLHFHSTRIKYVPWYCQAKDKTLISCIKLRFISLSAYLSRSPERQSQFFVILLASCLCLSVCLSLCLSVCLSVCPVILLQLSVGLPTTRISHEAPSHHQRDQRLYAF